MRRAIPLIGPSIRQMSPQAFYERVKSLLEVPEKTSSVDGIKISYGAKVTQVRVTRDERIATKEEVKLLAEEHNKSVEEIEELLTKRKVRIA